jgi:beta-N-acetylhexosaminidase
MKNVLLLVLLVFSLSLHAQYNVNLPANHWVDSVYNTLSDTQKIAQLMVVRLSAIDAVTGKISFFDQQVESDIRRFNVGGICLFQGGPKQQAVFINHFQEIAQTPVLF